MLSSFWHRERDRRGRLNFCNVLKACLLVSMTALATYMRCNAWAANDALDSCVAE